MNKPRRPPFFAECFTPVRVCPLTNAVPFGKSHALFGYNVYIGSTLIGFTENTSYTYTLGNSSPYGTYRVVATYKGYSGLQGTAATYTLEELEEPITPIEPEEPTIPTDETSCIEAGGIWDSTNNSCTINSSGTTTQ